MNHKGFLKIGIIALIAFLAAAAAYFLTAKKTVAPADVKTLAGKPEAPAAGEMQIFQGVSKSWFEGWDIITYEFSYPSGTFAFASKPEDNPIVLTNTKTSAQTEIKISCEGARGFSPEDYWNEMLKSKYPDYQEVPGNIKIAGAKVYGNGKSEWVILPAAPLLFAAQVQLPDDGVEQILSTLRVVSAKTQQPSSEFKVYFLKQEAGVADECRNTVAVDRMVPKTPAVAAAAINELLKGPWDFEKTEGFVTAIPAGSALNSLTIENGVARADFNAATESGGGSCSMAGRVAQIQKTLLQFPSVTSVVLSINGRTDGIFQP